jgi:hypothetical protein
MRMLLNGIVALATLAGCAAAAEPAPPAAKSKPVAPAPAAPPAGSALSAESSVDQILDALDARGRDLKSFTADVSLTEGDAALANEVTRRGKVVFQGRDGKPRLRVTFNERDTGQRVFAEKVEYLLEDGWLTDRNYEKKVEVRRQVLKPGEKLDLLKLGEGPFPLPIGQKKEAVHEQFDVKKIPPSKEDPAGSVHVELTPKAGTQLARRFDVIDVWVDPKTNMPARIDTAQGETVRTTELTNFAPNPDPALKDADFTLPAIDKGTWDLHEEPFSE